MGKSSAPSTQTVVNKTELPQWVQDAGQKNLAAAYDVSANMMGPYTGPRVAGLTNGALSDIAAVQDNVGSTNPAFAYAQDTAGNIANYQPGQVSPTTLAGTDLSAYMNPYTQSVINSGMQAIDTQRRQALNQIGDQAVRTGAFGGSRQGVQEGITNAASALQAGNLASQLMGQNFSQAQAAAQGDITRNLQAQIQNQNAGLQGAGLNLTAANNLGSLAAQGQNAFLQGQAAALAGQGAVQQQNQADIAAQQQAYQEAQQFPLQQLQIPLQALGATPYGSTNTQTGPGPSQNTGMMGLGGAMAGASIGQMIAPALGVSAGAGAGGGAGIGALLALLGGSDERLKTDVEKIGKDEETGLPLYAYRYKGDPKTYPKVVGPMAQDIEKKYPDQVAKVGDKGMRAVNLGFGPMKRAFS
ncbi:chaperone of endosialidase [Caudoviricetes sp.]|nr:chaperone of endosialidase [Caudoviricetes sp.]